MTNARTLMKRIQTLPPEGLVEIERFVESVAAKARRREVMERLLAIAAGLEVAGFDPMTEAEIIAEVDVACAATFPRNW
jgi:hypothetical protein